MEYHYIAYIDEAGDDGLRSVKPIDKNGSSEWLILSAVVIQASEEQAIKNWVDDIFLDIRSTHKQIRHMHFKNLRDDVKESVCSTVASLPLRCFVVASNKKNMRGYENPDAAKIPSKNWFYCWLTRILLERVTNYVERRSIKRYGEIKKVKIEYSERGGLSYSQMSAYFRWISMKSSAMNLFLPIGDLSWDTISYDLMKVYNHKERHGLQLADIVASAFFKGCDVYDVKVCDPRYAKLLRPRMARALYDGEEIISGYGLKLLPGLARAELEPEQEEIFRFYGYPKQWWDPDPSNPRAFRPATSIRQPSHRTPRG